jgi:hypothetical protein
MRSFLSFAFRAFLAPVAVMSAVCVLSYFVLPQPEFRRVGTIYKPDLLLLVACIAGAVPWLLCAFFSRPIWWLFHISLLVGLVAGALFWFMVYAKLRMCAPC